MLFINDGLHLKGCDFQVLLLLLEQLSMISLCGFLLLEEDLEIRLTFRSPMSMRSWKLTFEFFQILHPGKVCLFLPSSYFSSYSHTVMEIWSASACCRWPSVKGSVYLLGRSSMRSVVPKNTTPDITQIFSLYSLH